ncbi:AbrB/MazE/SpoVT family DNA-binding domain-containing protein [Alicyclobacillus fodiniaquatilis]|jgi:bifunctional DNA-binding transcriptional regulator/antitoxin component of YhaV-PrlF toxin-antitoxin module|uniref:AbrB/MazE/SpoVT family DNA-binding domain-containing protein n=1 Tax=Alicyclobacillus fodiniaquatilis TaxID=1661150 RepID=A0ABW4JMY3_9BACL
MTQSAYAKNVLERGHSGMDKYVRITGKRQVTIPKEFFEQLDMGTVLHAFIEGGCLILEPVRPEDPMDFSQEIINDLADAGLTGEELKKEFARRREGMMAAMKELVTDARKEALSGSESDGDDFMDELINTDE